VEGHVIGDSAHHLRHGRVPATVAMVARAATTADECVSLGSTVPIPAVCEEPRCHGVARFGFGFGVVEALTGAATSLGVEDAPPSLHGYQTQALVVN
jgi:hypothetical protein